MPSVRRHARDSTLCAELTQPRCRSSPWRSQPTVRRPDNRLCYRARGLSVPTATRENDTREWALHANRLPPPPSKSFGVSTGVPRLAIFKKPPENHLFIFRQAIRESPQLLQSLFMPQLPKQINSPTGHCKGEREACRGEDVDSHAQSLVTCHARRATAPQHGHLRSRRAISVLTRWRSVGIESGTWRCARPAAARSVIFG